MKLIVVFINSANVPNNCTSRNPDPFGLFSYFCYVKSNTTNNLSSKVFVLCQIFHNYSKVVKSRTSRII